tara:strand:- start:139 stop:447 length:309 start_codon:yes stop_codon:yes gene_type:complete
MTLITLAERFEQASKAYATSNGIARAPDWFVLKLAEEVGELTQAWIKLTGRGRNNHMASDKLQQHLADETADLLGHVLLFAHQNKIDLTAAIERKWRFSPDV